MGDFVFRDWLSVGFVSHGFLFFLLLLVYVDSENKETNLFPGWVAE